MKELMTNYVKQLSDDGLYNLFEILIFEMNERKDKERENFKAMSEFIKKQNEG